LDSDKTLGMSRRNWVAETTIAIPGSSRSPRILADQWGAIIDQPLPRAMSVRMSCCSRLLFGMNRMLRCCTAVQIAPASLRSFFCRRTNGFT